MSKNNFLIDKITIRKYFFPIEYVTQHAFSHHCELQMLRRIHHFILYVLYQGTYVQWGPGVVFGSLSVLVTILFLWLPETTGKELPNTLDDVKMFLVAKGDKK